jgi:PPOX class probable F420-dependent enzyme
MNAVVVTPAAFAAPTRPGYDPDAGVTARRVRPMLDRERVVWLSTVHPDGRPHLVPTWFWWDGSALVFWSKPDAVKVRNLRANPRLMIALGDPGADFSVGLIEARAALVAAPAPAGFFAKYREELDAAGLDAVAFRSLYPQAVRVTPSRFLAWHGRGVRRDGPALVRRTTLAADLAGWLAARFESLSARLRLVAGPAPA